MTDQTKHPHTDNANPGIPTKQPPENRGTSGGQAEPNAQTKPPKTDGENKEQNKGTGTHNR